MRSPEAEMVEPVRMMTPASVAAGPTVGANCRRVVTTDAMGRLNAGADVRWRLRGGLGALDARRR